MRKGPAGTAFYTPPSHLPGKGHGGLIWARRLTGAVEVLGCERMVLAAQTSAMGLYERAGYTARGDVFLDAGIEHMTMEKALA